MHGCEEVVRILLERWVICCFLFYFPSKITWLHFLLLFSFSMGVLVHVERIYCALLHYLLKDPFRL